MIPARLEIGFIGTQVGMTWEQMCAVFDILSRNHGWLHHGDCVGADHMAHGVAREAGWSVTLHPPTEDRKRAFCVGDRAWFAKPYLERNRDIVDATIGLIATPAGFQEELRSGTWSTVRYARKKGRPIKIVMPDGSVMVEARRV